MATEQSEFELAPDRRRALPVSSTPATGDRSAALLAELQAVCQRILASDPRLPAGSAPLTTMASVANGTAVANSLEALRRQCMDNYQQVGELKRAVEVHRGVVAGDSATNGRMLVELSRSVEALVAAAERDRTESHSQTGDLVRSVESLRVGLAGFSASNRQQVSELRGAVETLEHTVSAFGEQVQNALNVLGGHVQTALTNLGEQVVLALQETRLQVGTGLEETGRQVGRQAEETRRHVGREMEETRGQVVQEMEETRGQVVQEMEETRAQVGRSLQETGDHVGREMDRQTAAYEALLNELLPRQTRERLDELENMLSVGLPKFSEEIQAGVQQTLLAVSRTFRLAEREHGNRMGELHRDFDATIRRLEATLQARRREETVR